MRYKLVVEEIPEGETKEEVIKVAIELDPVAIFNSLSEGEKGKLLFRLLAAVLHEDNELAHMPKYREAIIQGVHAIRRIYKERWTTRSCGLSVDDAEMFGWDVSYKRKREEVKDSDA